MLLKLLKYDFKSARKYCLPLLIALAAGTLIGCVCSPTMFNVMMIDEYPEGAAGALLAVASIFSVLGFMAAVFIITISVSLFQIMICVEFYRSLVTDEGYLTFTLPVKAKDIIFSKLLNGFIWTMIGFASLAASILLIVASTALFTDNLMGGEAAPSLFGFEEVVMFIVVGLYVIVSAISSLLLYFTAIFLGSVIAKKNKLIVAIGCVFGANFAYGMVTGIASFGIELVAIGFTIPFEASVLLPTILSLGMMTVFSIVMAVILFFVLKHLMEKKLNLA